LAQRRDIVAALSALVTGVIAETELLAPYETDGLTLYREPPLAVVLPRSTEEVAAVLRYCHGKGVRVVPRGAGTSLSGAALPMGDAIVLGMARMNKILDVNFADRLARVEAGVTNLRITDEVLAHGFFYAPDPSSQLACMIGGNVAMNSGGAHCLKYGVTSNNILGLRFVTIEGEILDFGGGHLDAAGIDWLGLITGSEGMLGVITEVTVRLLAAAEGQRAMLAGFASSADAGAAVAAIIGSGLIPVALEFMDKPCIHACEAFAHAGYPLDAEALLIIEVEGSPEEQTRDLDLLAGICARFSPVAMTIAETAAQSEAIWKGRKGAFGAVGRISPDYLCMDGVIPTGKLAETLVMIAGLAADYALAVCNVFHAGDGNLHPLIMFDANDAASVARAEQLGAAILKLCVAQGGCLTGEHGVGIEKRDLMPVQFSAPELALQRRIKTVFDDKWLLNPSKVFPLNEAA
jgi:glycolate oxidase